MKTFYFFATVANSAANVVRFSRGADNRSDAFAAAVMALRSAGADIVSIQSANLEQYESAISVEFLRYVTFPGPISTEVLNPV